MTKHVRLLAPIGMLAVISCSSVMAQATGSHVLQHEAGRRGVAGSNSTRLSSQWATRLPSPVRPSPVRPSSVRPSSVQPAGHHQPLSVVDPASVEPLTAVEASYGLPAHRILRAPETVPNGDSARSRHDPKAPHYPRPPRVGLRRRIAPPPAMLPGANRSETWKTPYSYGYFGASGKRQWSLSHGYRDRYTQWELR